MNQVLAGTAALFLTFLLWGLGKKPRNFLSSKNSQKLIQVINSPKITLVKNSKDLEHTKAQVITKSQVDWEPPQSIQERILLRKKLHQLMAGGPEERLEAVILCDLWGHLSVLPILKLGLRDMDSDVVKSAAKTLWRYKGKSSQDVQGSRRPPRNVALMR